MAILRIAIFSILSVVSFAMAKAESRVDCITNVNGLPSNSVNCIFEDSDHTMWFGTWGGLCSYNSRDITTYQFRKHAPNTISNNVILSIVESGKHLWIETDNGVNRLNKQTKQIDCYFVTQANMHTNQIGADSHGTVYCIRDGREFYVFKDERFIPISSDFPLRVSHFEIIDAMAYFLFDDKRAYSYPLSSVESKGFSQSQLCLLQENVQQCFSYNKDIAFRSFNQLTTYQGGKIHETLEVDASWDISQMARIEGKTFLSLRGNGVVEKSEKETTFTHKPNLPNNLMVNTLFADSQGVLWMGTDGQGVMKMYEYQPIFHAVEYNYPVRSICETSSNSILVGTKGGGILQLDKASKTLQPLYSVENGLISNAVYVMRKNQQGDIFVGTEGKGVNIIFQNGKVGRLKIKDSHTEIGPIYNIQFTNQDSVLWVTTAQHGIYSFKLNATGGNYFATDMRNFSSSKTDNSIRVNTVYAAVPVEDEDLWVGSRGGGIGRISQKKDKTIRLPELCPNDSLSDNDVLSLAVEGANLWIGTSCGLNKLVYENGKYKLESEFGGDLRFVTVHSILTEEPNRQWIGTNEGLFRIDSGNEPERFTIRNGLPSNEFSDGACYKGSDGTLYFGTVTGLACFDPRTQIRREFTPPLELAGLTIRNESVSNLYEYVDSLQNIHLRYDERHFVLQFVAKDYVNSSGCLYAYSFNDGKDWWELASDAMLTLRAHSGTYKMLVKCSNSDRLWSDETVLFTIHVDRPWWLSNWAWLIYISLFILIIVLTIRYVQEHIHARQKLFMVRMDQRRAKKIYEAQLSFYTDIAHEVFTPLSVIYPSAQYLAENFALEDKAMHYVKTIRDNAEQMKRVIDGSIERNAKNNHTALVNKEQETPAKASAPSSIMDTSSRLLYILLDDKMESLIQDVLVGFNVCFYYSEDEFFAALRLNEPEAIIINLSSKEQSIQTIKSIKDNNQIAHIPIVLLSAQSLEYEVAAYGEGVDIYLPKPFHPRQLISAVNNLINRHSMLKSYYNSRLSATTVRRGKNLYDEDLKMVESIRSYVLENLSDSNLSPQNIADHLAMSRVSLYRKFKELLNTTPSEYINTLRLEQAAKLLTTSKLTVSEILFDVGFANKSYFYREFKRVYGCTPNDYRK